MLDVCPLCGHKMVPVLDRDRARPASGPLSADPQVRLACPTCPPLQVPELGAG
jgi:hypothetical protein